ncbi:UDP-N-acetylmuramoyl-tripeptide--D-alanyl-D-alanine ligase [Planosporangium flavigriseum]|uniref:UDP-N-acetylmuramoyl-tripeptide--D-alanyl-D-alanine ligase n=1 Tax=Planosporangium flavigriseum TaxID=373681 RepID=A0A8J3LRT9_9ACTN|nr:UDP-N-acetylmuramoyl-tripeptide--D-alanyl-D-alanine ligase [Planosporangium flavigriseum]NJC63213.1 UDP-N-acetylmuramoyl-tripeptide--D-alanyl-D-alanine ligase [Planosporangium flavigriseum]GIG72486.1 UDP-N-acetylmuramoyl-tripeptide--D-alanyl-D-alanine ligase [Planosporangium flavigriseum]
MIPLTLAEIAEITGADLVGAAPTDRVTGTVEYDSRKVGRGGLFVAFPGEKVDGHDYAGVAMAAGAVAVLGSRPVQGVPMLVVGDALTALGRLARAVRDRLPRLTVVGITGSSGKTTTKDLIGQTLAHLGEVVAPAGSLNNELGLPHTVLRATAETRYLVLEMGARGVGHIRYLCDIARPDIGVVINVGSAHLGEFGSVERIATAKSELVTALTADGLAVLNADDPRVRAMSALARGRVTLAGEAPDAAVRAEAVVLDERGRASYDLVAAGRRAAVSLGVTGRHQVGNSLLAAAVATSLGMAVPDVAAALSELELMSSRRMDVFDRADGVTVIDDSYNANPSSMAAALTALAEMGRARRTIAVLGYMAELGEHERAGHEEAGRLAAELGVGLLVVVGDAAAPIGAGADSVANWGGKSVLVTDQDAAIAVLRDELRSGDVVLCKGSRYRTWQVVDALRETAEAAGVQA